MYSSMKIRQGTELKAKALALAMKRKEEYLGARVPRELKERVIGQAAQLGIPVSILIRRVLEEAFGEPKPAPAGSGRVEESDARHPEGGNRFPMVLGWENIRLNRMASCTECGQQLKAGKQVLMGISPPKEERILLCDVCKESL
jgi:hypothetical protein